MSPRCSGGWRRFRRAIELATAVVVLAVATPAAGAADVEFRATVAPDRVVFGETEKLTYSVEMTTGEEPERFELSANAQDAFGGQGTLLFLGGDDVRLDGPGTLRPPRMTHADLFPCSHSGLRERHGGLPNGMVLGVELPANATSTLVFSARVSGFAPWPADRFALALAAFNGSEGTLAAPGPVPVDAPPPGGRTGVRLEIATDPPSAPVCGKPPRIDGPLAITGQSDPPLDGQDIVLRYVPPGERAAVTLATVRTAADGTFSYAGWRPSVPGVYELAAEYAAQRPDRADDFSVPRVFELVVPAGEQPPPPTPDAKATPGDPPPPPPAVTRARLFASIVSRRVALGRRGRARVRLACPAAAGAGCDGVLRLLRSGRQVARRRVRMAAGSRRTFAVRLRNASARRALRRRGRLVVTADAGGPARRVIIRPWPTR